MLQTLKGIYENGQIQLSELPENVSDRSQVLVTFLDGGKIDVAKLRELIERLETVAGIEQGFEQLNSGQTRSIGDFVEEMQKKYEIQG